MGRKEDIAFGRFRFDATNECLWDGERQIALRPKAFAVLNLLVQNAGQLITKQYVLDSVWPGTFVGDAVLKDCIRQLREALGDSADSPTYIETAHRRGYRFIAKLSATPAAAIQPNTAVLPESANAPGVLGRESEIAKLRGWLERALAGQRQTIFVTGEAGIGKTTLVQALIQQAALIPEVLIARGQCLEHFGSGEAYMPVLDGLSRLGRSPSGARLVKLISQHAPAWLAQMPSLVAASERASLQTPVQGVTRERMLREMAEAIEAITAKTPLILVLEDLHWSDYSTLDLISYLARRTDPALLMVIGTYRPVEVILGDHPLKTVKRELQAHALCQELPLEYLTEEAVAEYLGAKFSAHQFSNRLARMIHRRTEGNPLFMVNVVEYLIDEKLIVENQGKWELPVDLAQVELGVPESIKQLIERQIERLRPDERKVLEAGSAVGVEFSSVDIAAGLDIPAEWVEKQCEELSRRHHFLSPAWLIELPDGTITPRYRFTHILYREVPYSLMPPMRRSQIHRRVAERQIETYGDRGGEIAAELAMHFEQSREWPRALQYLIQAAQNASGKSAHHEAADLARRGLQVLKPMPKSTGQCDQEIALRMILVVSLMAIKGFASSEIEDVYADGEEMFGLSEPSPQLFNALYLHGLFYLIGGKIHSGLEIANRILKLANDLEDPTLIMEAHRAMGSTLLEMGRCSEALEHFDQASQLYTANQHRPYALTIGHDCKVLSECAASRALWALGSPDAALKRMQRGLAFARELAHPQSLVGALHFATQLHNLRGEFALSMERASEVIKVADTYGLELWVAFGKIDLGCANAALGNVQQGLEQIEQGLAAYKATGGKLWLPSFLGSLADALAKAGRIEGSLRTIDQALTQAEETGERYSLPELYRIKGELIEQDGGRQPGKLHRNNHSKPDNVSPIRSKAESCFAESLAIAKQQQTISWELRTNLSLCRANSQLDSGTYEKLAQTYSSFIEGFETADLKQARDLLDMFSSATSPLANDVRRGQV
jgi:DNA-binding winged helix-turn-helix (wHTH) protein/predicted ATPase